MSAWPILGESAVNFHVEKETPWKRSYTARGPHRNVLIAVTSTTSNKKVHFSELFSNRTADPENSQRRTNAVLLQLGVTA